MSNSKPHPHAPNSGATLNALDRRSFLKTQIQGLMMLTLGTTGLLGRPGSAIAQSASGGDPVTVNGQPYIGIAEGDPAKATRAAVDLIGGIKSVVKPGRKVVIKPNMSFIGPPELATTTHPAVVRELVAMCREAGAGRIRVLDHPLRGNEQCIEGVKKACADFKEDLVFGLTQRRFFKSVTIPTAVSFKNTDVMHDVLDADVLISVPVAKSHGSTGVSLSLKGMMGLIFDRGVMHWKYDLHTAIVDLAAFLPPHLVVIDATRVLSTNGPGGPGKVLTPNMVIATRDMVAADAKAVSMFEWYGQRMEPRQVKHILLAHERNLGRMDLENLATKQIKV